MEEKEEVALPGQRVAGAEERDKGNMKGFEGGWSSSGDSYAH